MKALKEQDIQSQILAYLRLNGYIAFKHHSTGMTVRNGKTVFLNYGQKGISDIIACNKEGKFIAIEVKRKSNKASPEQLEFLENVRGHGAIGILAYCLEDVIDVLDNL